MNKTLLFLFLLIVSFQAKAVRISGTVTNAAGEPLSYASVFIKGTSLGTTANNEGKYFIELEPGQYTVVAQYVGYTRQEKKLQVKKEPLTLDFVLSPQELSLAEVVVTPGAEDPAYEIIRQAIRKRPEYKEPLDSFTCDAYIKTLIRTRKLPKKILGQEIDTDDLEEMGVDSSGKGIVSLSESITRIAFRKPDDLKLEVLSGRESGSNGFGFNFPSFINLYENNVQVITSQFNPRGFVSPVADGALNYYRYKYEGSFFEDGKEINRIQVIPRRKYEPLFSGTINITEGDWRIHSADLLLTKTAQLEILDTIRIKQIHVPVTPQVWRTKDQLVYFTFNLLGIDAVGNFLNVYNNYDVAPKFPPRYFNNVVVKYDTAVNKKTAAYWDSIRPVPLEPEEVADYHVKDSVYAWHRDSSGTRQNRDSLLKKQGPVTVKQLLWSGFSRSNYHPQHPTQLTWSPLLKQVRYNTVEGIVAEADAHVIRRLKKEGAQVDLNPHARYGFSNHHFNAWAGLTYSNRSFMRTEEGGSTTRYSWTLAGGKRVSQFNKDEPIKPLLNSVYTLLAHHNYMKIYENYFGSLAYRYRFDNGLQLSATLLYEDRLPINNTTDYAFNKNKDKVFTPNYPFEQLDSQFIRHQAVTVKLHGEFRPGQRYIQFPRYKMAIGSRYPVFAVDYEKGIKDLAGSDVDFDKWQVSVWDDMNFHLKGTLKYRLSAGGFFNSSAVPIQDYQHFNGNQLLFASQYMNSFQLAPYYANSTTAALYATAHLEHHLNGFLTNKIPLFRRLNWHLVAGTNAFYVNTDNNYVEVFGGIENIFKLFRVDVVASYLDGHHGQVGLRIGLGGLLGSAIRVE